MKRIITIIGLYFVALAVSHPADAQFFKKLADKVAERVEDKVINDAGDAAVKGVDRTEDAIGNAAKSDQGNDKKKAGAERQNRAPQAPQNRTTATKQTGAPIPDNAPENREMGEVNVNYDFRPGERTLFEADFSDVVVGDFPQNLEFRGGQLSVVSYSGERAIKASTSGAFAIKLPEELPERFTIEFDEFNSDYSNHMSVEIVDDTFNGLGEHYIKIDGYGSAGSGVAAIKSDGVSSLRASEAINKQMTSIAVMVDGAYVKVYVGKTRVANMPNAILGRSSILLFKFGGLLSKPIYVANIRVAAGERSLSQALEATGRGAIHDLHCTTAKADILPESVETIKAITDLRKAHPKLKLLIEGHTDNVGDFNKNIAFSKSRSNGVAACLIQQYKVDGDRLKATGTGVPRLMASNETEKGRAENRRVEIAKL